MAKQGSNFLDTGDALPELELTLVDGAKMKVPQDLGDGWKVFLFFRGYF
ncbi:MAG: hypothetical protein ACE5JS_00760 [Nitrospinota bacterium]